MTETKQITRFEKSTHKVSSWIEPYLLGLRIKSTVDLVGNFTSFFQAGFQVESADAKRLEIDWLFSSTGHTYGPKKEDPHKSVGYHLLNNHEYGFQPPVFWKCWQTKSRTWLLFFQLPCTCLCFLFHNFPYVSWWPINSLLFIIFPSGQWPRAIQDLPSPGDRTERTRTSGCKQRTFGGRT